MAEYTVKYAPLECSNGSQIAYLNNQDRGTSVGTHAAALYTDSKPKDVLGNFGICSAAGENEDKICIKAFNGYWRNPSPTVYWSAHSEKLGKAIDYYCLALANYNAYNPALFNNSSDGVYFQYCAAMLTTFFVPQLENGTAVPIVKDWVALNPNPTAYVQNYQSKGIAESVIREEMLAQRDTYLQQLRDLPTSATGPDIGERIGEGNASGIERTERLSALVADLRHNVGVLKDMYNNRKDDRLQLANSKRLNALMNCLQYAERALQEAATTVDTTHIKVLTTESHLFCHRAGGTITFVDNGQTTLSYQEAKKRALEHLRERVRRAIRAHYGFPTPSQYMLINDNPVLTADDWFREKLAENGVSAENATKLQAAVTIENLEKQKEALTARLTALRVQLNASTADAAQTRTLQQQIDAAQAILDQINARLDEFGDATAQTAIKEYKSALADALAGNPVDTSVIDGYGFTPSEADLNPEFDYIDGESSHTTSVQVAIRTMQRLDRKAYAEEVIDTFHLQESSSPREEDVYNMLAWLILLEETDLVTVQNETAASEYEYVGLDSWTEAKYTTAAAAVLEMADNLAAVLPVPKGVDDPYIMFGYGKTKPGGVMHWGVDICTSRQTLIDVVAVRSGNIVLIRSGQFFRTEDQNATGSCVGVLCKNHGESASYTATEISYVYMHLQQVFADISTTSNDGKGTYVLAGKPLGECGNTGLSGEIHSHFEVQNGTPWNPGKYDPIPFLPDIDGVADVEFWKDTPPTA